MLSPVMAGCRVTVLDDLCMRWKPGTPDGGAGGWKVACLVFNTSFYARRPPATQVQSSPKTRRTRSAGKMSTGHLTISASPMRPTVPQPFTHQHLGTSLILIFHIF